MNQQPPFQNPHQQQQQTEEEQDGSPLDAATRGIAGCPPITEGRAPRVVPGMVSNPDTGEEWGGLVCNDAYGRGDGQCENMECIFYGGVGFSSDLNEPWAQWDMEDEDFEAELPSDDEVSSFGQNPQQPATPNPPVQPVQPVAAPAANWEDSKEDWKNQIGNSLMRGVTGELEQLGSQAIKGLFSNLTTGPPQPNPPMQQQPYTVPPQSVYPPPQPAVPPMMPPQQPPLDPRRRMPRSQ